MNLSSGTHGRQNRTQSNLTTLTSSANQSVWPSAQPHLPSLLWKIRLKTEAPQALLWQSFLKIIWPWVRSHASQSHIPRYGKALVISFLLKGMCQLHLIKCEDWY